MMIMIMDCLIDAMPMTTTTDDDDDVQLMTDVIMMAKYDNDLMIKFDCNDCAMLAI